MSRQRDKHKIFRRKIFARGIVRQYRNTLLCRHHHQNALDIGGAEQDIGPITRLLVQVHKKGVSVGIQCLCRRHINNRFSPQLPAGQPYPLRQRVSGVQRCHQPHLLHRQPVHPLVLLQVGAVPGQNEIKLIVEQPCGKLIGGAAVKGNQQIGVPLVELPQKIGEAALLVALQIADAQIAGQPGGSAVRAVYGMVHALQNRLGFGQKRLACRCQRYGAGAAVEQGAAQHLLQ